MLLVEKLNPEDPLLAGVDCDLCDGERRTPGNPAAGRPAFIVDTDAGAVLACEPCLFKFTAEVFEPAV